MLKKLIGQMVLVCLCSPAGLALAGDYGASSGVLLSRQASPRADGMAGAQAAVIVNEAGALGGNPAGLLGNRRQEVSAYGYRGLIDDMLGGGSYSANLSPALALGGSVLLYDAGTFELVSANGDASNLNAERDYLVNLTGAYQAGFLGQAFDVGINLKLLNSVLLNQYSAFAVAGDVGLRWELKGLIDNLYVGGAIKNIGTPMKYVEKAFPLPMQGLAGLAYQAVQGDQLQLLLAADVQSDLNTNVQENLGAEMWIFNQVALRGGYKLGSDIAGLTLGAGVRLGIVNLEFMQLDYAFSLMSALNSTHHLSLSYVFGTSTDPKAKTAKNQLSQAEPADLSQYAGEASQPNTAVEKVGAEILQAEKTGSRVTSVLLKIGSSQGVKEGQKGVIMNNAGQAVAGIRVQEVNATQSIAEVVGISCDLGKKPFAVIYIPR